jgi:hypothetical protein
LIPSFLLSSYVSFSFFLFAICHLFVFQFSLLSFPPFTVWFFYCPSFSPVFFKTINIPINNLFQDTDNKRSYIITSRINRINGRNLGVPAHRLKILQQASVQ